MPVSYTHLDVYKRQDLVFAAMIALFAVVMIGISVEDALHRR